MSKDNCRICGRELSTFESYTVDRAHVCHECYRDLTEEKDSRIEFAVIGVFVLFILLLAVSGLVHFFLGVMV